MAQYWEDWSGSTIGSEPTGWTKHFVTAGTLYRVEEDTSGHAPAGRRLLIDKSATDRAAITFDAVGALEADVQIRILARSLYAGSATTQYAGPAARVAGSAGSETVIYGAFVNESTTEKIRNIQISGGTVSALDYGAGSNSWVTAGYYWLTLTVSGGAATLTIADVETPEEIIDAATSTTTVTGAGGVGIFSSFSNTLIHVLAVGVGTDGDPAPYSAPASDTTAPTLTSPTASATGATTASGSVSTNETNGTLYYLASANATESVATVKAGSSQAVSASGVQGVAVTGLTASGSYYLHFVHTDAAENDSAVSTSEQFTTAAESVVVKGIVLALYDDATLQADITGIRALWWDSTEPTGAPDYETTTAATDAAGVMTLDLSAATSLAIEEPGFLLLYKLNLVDHRDSLQFAGRVIIEDIG
jgi:hypothetical protein